jgi:very-short-patch-repair endonuclease
MPTSNKFILKAYRRKLRKNLTPAEAFLWLHLKNKQLEGRRFRRQFSIDNYILDFYCPSEKLAIELDGARHFTHQGVEKDKVRDSFLKANGIGVIRIENKDVFDNTVHVIECIKQSFKK